MTAQELLTRLSKLSPEELARPAYIYIYETGVMVPMEVINPTPAGTDSEGEDYPECVVFSDV